MNKLTEFAKGIIAGFLIAVIVVCIIATLGFLKRRDREVVEYAERQQVIEVLREDGFLRNLSSILSLIKLWIKAFEFYPRIVCSKPPIDFFYTLVAEVVPCRNFFLHLFQCRDSL